MNKTVIAILILTVSYALFVFYAFGVFLQMPVVEGESLTVQAVLEPIVYIALMVIGNGAVIWAVSTNARVKERYTNERALFVPSIMLLLLMSFGAGMHTSAQLIEETFVNTSATMVHVTENFTSRVAYFLEEYPAHVLMFLPYGFLLYILAVVELNSIPARLRRYEQVVLVVSGIVYGTLFALLNAEGHVTIPALVIGGVLMFKWHRHRKRAKRTLWELPFGAQFMIGNGVMLLLGICFGAIFGWFIQPTELGFGS